MTDIKTHVLKVYRKGNASKPEYMSRISGSDRDADRQLGELWNNSKAPSEPGEWRATAYRLTGDKSRVSCID